MESLAASTSLERAGESPAPHGSAVSRAARFLPALVFLCLFAWAVALQYASGALSGELSGYPDEPGQYVTGVMVDQCVRQGCFASPVRFAEQYYLHYPKVAIGHWPPLLYLTQASWTLVFGPERLPAMLLQSFLAALLAWSLWLVVRPAAGAIAAAAVGFVWLSIPVVQRHTSMVMAEGLLALSMFLGAYWFGEFLKTGRTRYAALFTAATIAAVMTKGTGWALGLVAVFAIALSGRFAVLKRPALWVGALVTFAVCGPWQWYTMHMAAHGWHESNASLAYTFKALRNFAAMVPDILGWGLTAAVVAGLAAVAARARGWRMPPVPAAMLALFLAVYVFHSLVPAGIEDRKLLLGVPALLYFAACAFRAAAGAPLLRRWPPVWAAGAAALVFAAVFAAERFTVYRKTSSGFAEAAKFLASAPPRTAIFVSAGGDGEGLLISELAMLLPAPKHYVLRGTKLLAQMDWNGKDYVPVAQSEQQIQQILASVPVQYLVVDARPHPRPYPFQQLVENVAEGSGDWVLEAQFGRSPSGGANILVYRSTRGWSPAVRVSVDLRTRTGRILTTE